MSEEKKPDLQEIEEETSVVVLTDADGTEKEYTVLATFESEEGAQYVIYYDEEEDDEEATIYAARIEQDGEQDKLAPIESDEEWDMVDEVLRRMQEDEDDEEE